MSPTVDASQVIGSSGKLCFLSGGRVLTGPCLSFCKFFIVHYGSTQAHELLKESQPFPYVTTVGSRTLIHDGILAIIHPDSIRFVDIMTGKNISVKMVSLCAAPMLTLVLSKSSCRARLVNR